jgi:hypothetical protein
MGGGATLFDWWLCAVPNCPAPPRVHRINKSGVPRGGVSAHNNVARQQYANLPADIDRLMGQLRVARAQDQIVLYVLTELGLQRRLHIDLGQHTKSLLRERLPCTSDRIVERSVQGVVDSAIPIIDSSIFFAFCYLLTPARGTAFLAPTQSRVRSGAFGL